MGGRGKMREREGTQREKAGISTRGLGSAVDVYIVRGTYTLPAG